MKLLVIGGMHGNEPLGIELVRSLRAKRIKGVDSVLANETAVKLNKRFVVRDMNRSFPGDSDATLYELARPAQLLKITKSYDVVLDFHNTYCPDNDCGFVGESGNPQLYSVAKYLGLNRIIVADYDCVNKFAANCLSVEISLSSNRMDVSWWRKQLEELVAEDRLGVRNDVELYRFVYRMTNEDRDRLRLNNEKMTAFKPIKKAIADTLGVKSPAYPIFIADEYTPYNFGGLLNKIDV